MDLLEIWILSVTSNKMLNLLHYTFAHREFQVSIPKSC